jgi:hypothetical protein
MTEKEEPTLISAERKVNQLCKCWSKEPTIKLHTMEVLGAQQVAIRLSLRMDIC